MSSSHGMRDQYPACSSNINEWQILIFSPIPLTWQREHQTLPWCSHGRYVTRFLSQTSWVHEWSSIPPLHSTKIEWLKHSAVAISTGFCGSCLKINRQFNPSLSQKKDKQKIVSEVTKLGLTEVSYLGRTKSLEKKG